MVVLTLPALTNEKTYKVSPETSFFLKSYIIPRKEENCKKIL